MNCPHRINGPLNAAGAFLHCKQAKVGGNAYNKYRVHFAELLGFITNVER